jgi:hypothetical protein
LRVTGVYQNAQQNISGLTVGAIYRVDAYVLSGSSGNEAGFIQFDMGSGNYIRKNLTSSYTWTQYSIIFKATATSGTLEVTKFTATPGIMYFDSVVMTLCSEGNLYINFDEGGVELEGVLAAGQVYNGNTMATAIAAAMNAAPGKALTYTCTYSDTTYKFTIGAGANFTLRWATGSKSGGDISGLCGYDDSANDTGAAIYVSNYVRINTYEYIDVDLGVMARYDFVVLLNHNLSTGAVIWISGAESADFATGLVADTITNAGNNIYFFLAAQRTKRYVRLSIYNADNPSGYIQVGNVGLYAYVEFTPYIAAGGYNRGAENPSLIDFSDSQNLFADDKPRLFKRGYPFEGLSNTDASNIELMQDECGDHKGLVVCTNPDDPNHYSEWVTLAELNEVAYGHENYWNWTMNVREHK